MWVESLWKYVYYADGYIFLIYIGISFFYERPQQKAIFPNIAVKTILAVLRDITTFNISGMLICQHSVQI